MKTAVFFERDGILNEAPTEGTKQVIPTRLEEFKINQGAIAPLKALKEAGFLLIVTTNQPGISTGTIERRELDLMHKVQKRRLPVDDIYMCPYEASEGCPCHKPSIGMFQEAAYKWNIDLNHSFVVSDKWPDAKAALNIGAYSVMLRSPWIGDCHHDFVCDSLDDIVAKIRQVQEQPGMALSAA